MRLGSESHLFDVPEDVVYFEENWVNRDGSEDFSRLVDYTDEYRPGARRFDVGARTNFGLVPMAIAATEQLLEWGVAEIASSLQAVTDEIALRAAVLGFDVPDSGRRGPTSSASTCRTARPVLSARSLRSAASSSACAATRSGSRPICTTRPATSIASSTVWPPRFSRRRPTSC